MSSMSSDGGFTGLAEVCYYRCGRDSWWRFCCRSCEGPQQVAVQFFVCKECRPRTKCFHCDQYATDECFRTDSDAADECFRANSDNPTSLDFSAVDMRDSESSVARCTSPGSNALALGLGNRADMVEQLRNLVTTLENLTPQLDSQPDLCTEIAHTHAKCELHRQLQRILRRPTMSSEVVYTISSPASGNFQADATMAALCDASQGTPLSSRGSICRSEKDAERSAAFVMLSQLKQGLWSPKPR